MLLKDLQTLASKLTTGTLFHVEKAGKAYSVDYSALAKAIIEEYADSTVGGSKQSVQAAIGALNSNKTSNYFVNVNNESTFQTAVNKALKTIGNMEFGRLFTFSIRFNESYYFGIACYSLSDISFGRLFNVNTGIVYSFRNNNSDSSATTKEFHFVDE